MYEFLGIKIEFKAQYINDFIMKNAKELHAIQQIREIRQNNLPKNNALLLYESMAMTLEEQKDEISFYDEIRKKLRQYDRILSNSTNSPHTEEAISAVTKENITLTELHLKVRNKWIDLKHMVRETEKIFNETDKEIEQALGTSSSTQNSSNSSSNGGYSEGNYNNGYGGHSGSSNGMLQQYDNSHNSGSSNSGYETSRGGDVRRTQQAEVPERKYPYSYQQGDKWFTILTKKQAKAGISDHGRFYPKKPGKKEKGLYYPYIYLNRAMRRYDTVHEGPESEYPYSYKQDNKYFTILKEGDDPTEGRFYKKVPKKQKNRTYPYFYYSRGCGDYVWIMKPDPKTCCIM